MVKILDICKANDIPMFATFVFAPDGFCTSSLPVSMFYPEELESEENKALLKAYKSIKNEPELFAFTITTTNKTDSQ